MISLLGPLVVWALGAIPVVPELGGGFGLSIASVGLGPVVTAFVIVEIAALLVPGWRRLRVGGPAGRLRLSMATAVVAVVLTMGQAWNTGRIIAEVQMTTPGGIPLAVAGASFLLAVVALAIDRHGLGSGFAIVFGSTLIIQDVPYWTMLFEHLSEFRDIAVHVIAPLAIAGLGLALAEGRLSLGLGAIHPAARVPFLACGMVALTVDAWFVGVDAIASEYDIEIPILSSLTADFDVAAYLVLLASSVTLAVLVFNWPSRVAEIVQRGLEIDRERAGVLARAAVGGALRAALLFGLAVLLFDHFAAGSSSEPVAGLPILTVFTVFVIARDLVLEHRARAKHEELVEIWPIHRPYAVATVLFVLEDAGIPAYAFGVGYRSLGQFFAPYAPIQIAVPRAEAERAQAIVEELLSPDATSRRRRGTAGPTDTE